MESELVSTEEVVNTLLEDLVGPLLPLRTSPVKEAPTLSQQQSVAKQLHAVVLLYNYYQRKQNPQAQYLDFVSFCKLAVTLKPVLVSYMKFMNQPDPTGSKDMDNDLSVTEKAIQDACKISCALVASKDVPSINEWLIAKVSVLLLDSKKENCWLLYSSVTDGVWSLLEKCLELPTAEIEGAQLAFRAVKDATSISRSDLMILEEHMVYSLAKEKTATCFYIMQCTQSINQDNQIPVKETLKSLQDPLVKRSSGSWSTTEVVEHFHLLPYASIMSAFFLREVSSLEGSNTRSHKDIADNCEKKFSESRISLFDQNLGNVSIMSAIDSDNACGIVVNDNNDMHDRNANPANSFSAEVVVNNSCENNTWDQKDFGKENGVHHKTVSAYGSFTGEAKEASASKRSQSIEEKTEKMEATTPDESDEALIGTKSDRINLEISEAKDGDGPLEKISYSAVGQEAIAVDGPRRIRKSEEAGRDSSIRNTEIVDLSGDKLTGVNLECLNDTSNKVHQENSRDYEDSTAKELCAIINHPRTPEEKAEELVKSTKSCEIDDFIGMELAGARLEPLENKRTRESDGQIIGNGVISKAQRTDEEKAIKECGLSTISPNQNGTSLAHTALVSYNHESPDISDLQTVLASKEKALSESSLMVLFRKREKLYQQQKIEDEIALCDTSIQRILDGVISISGFSCFILFQFLCISITLLHGLSCYPRRRPSNSTYERKEIVQSCTHSMTCMSGLHQICCVNNWMFPSYSVSATDGRFHARVTVKGVEFLYSCESDLAFQSLGSTGVNCISDDYQIRDYGGPRPLDCKRAKKHQYQHFKSY
ncbi:hypothetical protein K7X08_005294 [Anisodus acutangulus]|uniref:Uncharacterized protein n=1 Tax=Anisodus acutangulus TaxID=402998 RepID=A0A9Q1LUC7_9SOLA|nr:hypothetical protein K7X08_005294 [Anisodus acutangulus]